MRILLLTFYYQPDLSAGSFRNTALVKQLLPLLPQGVHIDVVTTLPNRYHTFSAEAPEKEELHRLTIHRIALSAHKSGMVDQSRAFLTYAKAALKLSKNTDYDLIFASSSRLMTAALGAWIARRKEVPLYLDIRDIFVDTINDVLSKKLVWLMKPIFSAVEAWTIKTAQKVNLVSAGFLPYFEPRYPRKNFSLFTNGIDDEFLLAQPEATETTDKEVLDVVYAGNMGEGQGLHNIIPELAKHFEGRLRFRLIGDGGRLNQLKEGLKQTNCSNVEILPPMQREGLIRAYQSADILFLHLNDYEAFRKVLPSKLFEYAAMGKPIWAGVAGYAAEFTTTNISNASVFPPCNASMAAEAFEKLSLVTEPREEFVKQFARVNIMQSMAADLLTLTGKN